VLRAEWLAGEHSLQRYYDSAAGFFVETMVVASGEITVSGYCTELHGDPLQQP
jgi:hypothetical protein